MTDLLNSDPGGYSTDPTRPDYACPAYREMAPRWSLVNDIREGTLTIRENKERYLPRFEAETIRDWQARVDMTFAADHYATTIEEHVGLIMAEPIKLGSDVAKPIADLMEDVDGEGNHLDVFAESVLDAASHLGHSVIWTDYPNAADFKNRRDERQAQARPYAQLYHADDVLSWRTETVGGVKVLVQVVFRERTTKAAGEFGTEACVRYREVKQQVAFDEFTGRARSLGAITWRAWEARKDASDTMQFAPAGEGTIEGPTRIPARIVYGGQRIGYLQSKPHLYGLALTNVEETQVGSDYAAVMHKCNVPTPIFFGRNTQQGDGSGQTVQMGQGIDIPIGGDAKYLEPGGSAIAATRTRLLDLTARMQRQGATSAQGEGGKVMSATEAAIAAKARNAKLRRAARSLQDAIEGMLADFASYMRLNITGSVKSGGSVTINTNFAGATLDPAYLSVLVAAYDQGTLTMEELRSAIHTGKLPEDFEYQDVIELLAAEQARKDMKIIEDAEQARRLAEAEAARGAA